MNRLLVSLGTAAAVLSATAVVLFLLGGTGATIGGAVVSVAAVLVWLATFGLARDPEARAVVAQRMAASRGQGDAPAQPTVAPKAPAKAPVVVPVEAEPTEGFTVGGSRRPTPQDRRPKQRKRS